MGFVEQVFATSFGFYTAAGMFVLVVLLVIMLITGSFAPVGIFLYLFKPFITSKPHGTGLGLVLVKKMLSNMNSTIEMESQEDVGTKAIISIPERQFVDR